MSSQTLTVAVPDKLFARIRDRAIRANRTVEAEVLDILSKALSPEDALLPDLEVAQKPHEAMSRSARGRFR